MRAIAAACPPLDLHTPYTYWVQVALFGDGCVIGEVAGEPVAFASSVVAGNRQFLWQIGVLPAYRCRGYSQLLIDSIISKALRDARDEVVLSIAPENAASLASVEAYARGKGLPLERYGSLDLRDQLTGFSEFEYLYRIPLPRPVRAS